MKNSKKSALNILAIDASLRTGLCVRCGDDILYSTAVSVSSKVTKDEAVYLQYRGVTDVLYDWPVDICVIERYAFGRGVFNRGIYTVGEVGGVVRLALTCRNIQYVELSPITWKSIVWGKLRFKKKTREDVREYLDFIWNKYGVRCVDDNEADAVCISDAMRIIIDDCTNRKYRKVVSEMTGLLGV
jgi:Holliday junction resolvasome RuvABC endonuclease subunit